MTVIGINAITVPESGGESWPAGSPSGQES